MNIREIKISKLKRNLSKNWKLSITILLLFCIIGLIYGVYQQRSYHPNKEELYFEEPRVSIDDIEKDEGYFFNVLEKVQRKADWLNLYFLYLSNVNVSSDSREKIDTLREKLDEFCEEGHEKCLTYFWNNTLSFGGVEESVGFYELKLHQVLDKSVQIEEELNIKQDSLSDDEIEILEDQLLNNKAVERKFNHLLELFNGTDDATILVKRDEGLKLLNEDIKSLNSIIDDFNRLMEEVSASENYEIIYNKSLYHDEYTYVGLAKTADAEKIMRDTLNNAVFYAKSFEGLDKGEERFFAGFTFFLLVGVVIAFSVAALRERDNDKV